MKSKIISLILIISLVSVCFSACSLFVPQPVQPTENNEPITEEVTEWADKDGKVSYTKMFTESKTADMPLMKTDFENVFYTMRTDGTVHFFKLIDGVLAETQADGSYDVKVKCSGQTIPAKIYYITVDGRVNGFGLYTSANAAGVLLYDYAFFKICDLPDAFQRKGKLLLLIDTDKTRFYDDKIYSEQFYFDTDALTTTYFLSEAQRQTGMDGLKMTDYKMFTDEMLQQPYRQFYFFSSRSYIADKVKKVDIYTSGGYDTNIDNIRVITNMLGMTFHRTDAGTYYYSKTETGFVLYFYDGKNYKTVREFSGDYNEDYIRSGTSILETDSGIVYDLVTDKEYKFDYSNFGTAFVVTDFVMNGNYAAIVGESLSGGLQIGLLNTQNNEMTIVNGFTNKNMEQIHITDEGYLVISVCYESDYTAYQLICDLNRFIGVQDEAATATSDISEKNGSEDASENTSDE